MSGDGDILFQLRGALLVVTLNRPKALNSLTLEMCQAFDDRLAESIADGRVRAILIKGTGERAFCAGGDVRRLYDEGQARGSYAYDFYRDEYRLNTRIFHCPKPYVALMDGIVMGGGVGVSVHGSRRVVSERIMFAMPETGIGLFPDVGGSYFLSRLPGQIGMYMALTGARLNAADAVYAGVGDRFVPSDRLQDLEDALAQADLSAGAANAVDDVIARFATATEEAPMAALRAEIDRTFDQQSVESIVAALQAETSAWSEKTLTIMQQKSPTSMKVTFRQIRAGAGLDFNDCMRMEYRLANGCLHGHDLYEGIRAVVIDKDQAPRWEPARLEEVGEDAVEPYFNDTPRGGDLRFPSDD